MTVFNCTQFTIIDEISGKKVPFSRAYFKTLFDNSPSRENILTSKAKYDRIISNFCLFFCFFHFSLMSIDKTLSQSTWRQ